jgi:aspartate/methionine/tyrosine aminotransferase
MTNSASQNEVLGSTHKIIKMADDSRALEEALQKQAELAEEISTLRSRIASSANAGEEHASKKQKTTEFRFSALLKAIKPSGTVMVMAKVKQLQAEGQKIHSLSVGEPDFTPPPEVLAATKSAVDEGIYKYTTVQGTLELRDAICKDISARKGVSYTTDEIMVSIGAKQAVYVAVLALCGPGDQVMTFAPYYVSYTEIARMAGASAVILDSTAESGFLVSAEELAQGLRANPRTSMIILCNPSNPTGAMMDKKLLEAYAEVLQRPENRHIMIVVDDIYETLEYDTPHATMACIAGMKPRCVTVNGFSKSYGMTGYRLGYLAADAQVVKACAKLQGQINTCASAIAQHAAVQALTSTPASWMTSMVANMRVKRDLVVEAMREMPGVKLQVVPQGAFYVMPDISGLYGKRTPQGETINGSNDFCLHLLSEYKTALVPGAAFGYDKGIRVAFATDTDTLREAMTRIGQCVAALQ